VSPFFDDQVALRQEIESALDAADGSFKWKYPTDGGIVSKPAIADENVFFGSEDKRLHVISARSGKISWSHYAEGHVFIGSDDSCLHAINSMTGRSAWTFTADDAVRSTPFVAHDLIYFGSENGEFYCLMFL